MFAVRTADGVTRARTTGTRWLATGPRGGFATADCTYNVTVPSGFDRRDVASYLTDRLRAAGFESDGPTMLTAVDQRHLRGARAGSVTVLATAGLTNPAALAVPAPESDRSDRQCHEGSADTADTSDADPPDCGTINLVVGTERSLGDGTLATLLATAVEAKTATVQATTGFTGTTTDAVVAGCDPAGERVDFAGSATDLGAATRACVRDALLASLRSGDRVASAPDSVAAAAHGVRTDRSATVFDPCDTERVP